MCKDRSLISAIGSRVKKTLRQPGDICYLANQSIADLPSHFATLLVQGDYDAVGEEGGNKLESNHQLFGIDFGHAYRNDNQIIQHLLPNLHLPAKQIPHYKNFSLFHDSKRSEIMQGILIYAKLAGKKIEEEVLQGYGNAFIERLDKIQSGDIERVIDAYISYFQTRTRKEPQYQPHYSAIISDIQATKKRVLASIEVF